MQLTEAEKRIVFQIEATDANTALREIQALIRCATSQSIKDAAESLVNKLHALPNQECMNLICEMQANYHLPEKASTIGELTAEIRQQSGAEKLSGHDVMGLERFSPETKHMIVFQVISHNSPVGSKGEKMRLFLSDTGYQKALKSQQNQDIVILEHAQVISGNLRYDEPPVSTIPT